MSKQLRFWIMTALATVALSANGCSSSEKKEENPFTYPDVGSFCLAQAKAQCSAKVEELCAVNHDTCVQNRQKHCILPASEKYRPAAADECILAMTAAYSTGKLTAELLSNVQQKCMLVEGGSGGADADCKTIADCQYKSGLDCVRGKCEIPKKVGGGESCKDSTAVCQTGQYCNSTQHCIAYPEQGEACTAEIPCNTDTSYCLNGTCVARIAKGESCTLECADGLCLNSVCENKVCRPVPNQGADAGAAGGRCEDITLTVFDQFCLEATGS